MLALFAVFDHLSNARRVLNRYHFLYTSSTATPPTAPVLKEESTSITTQIIPTQQVTIDKTKNYIVHRNNVANISSPYNQTYEHNILLTPIIYHIIIQLNDNIVELFDSNLLDDLHEQHELARELDACLLEIKTIEKDLYKFKQRQCILYESFIEFVDKKDKLIQLFIDYHSEYYGDESNTIDEIGEYIEQAQKRKKKRQTLRRQSTIYEYTIPVSNRFELLRKQSLLHTLSIDFEQEQ
ncbi:unnamed protein product [Didymodactylos carnosus]|uniref:Uncharacterized protein n=1 Tax=Didymodactylos carnosus TaxID=1234261 RepID=A0A813SYT9_9BILA|nr:unnamed protein product [Didymodactylos carnosus]CAF0835855.1 unnamed protein product [Didymodactylos carnosus]CAF3589157.1 unnamed protein product [Didymodactylos carnosus]CAF3620764.1 unnamed protein product [Didymodactylos carnosus]